MCWIDLPLHEIALNDRGRVVKARIVDVAPHMAHRWSFAVHKNPWHGGWSVSNIETGAGLWPSHADTAAQAVKCARQYLAQKDPVEADRWLDERWGHMRHNVRSQAGTTGARPD